MRKRCSNPNDANYEKYGARGIRVCARWEKFESFIADMGRKPGPRYSVERRDNNGNYEPGNCYWATDTEQARNKRSNRLITHDGRTQCLSAWAAESPVSPQHLRGRLRDGWEFADAIRAPLGAKRPDRSRAPLNVTQPAD
jgi:hypothetical protein